MYQLEYRKGAFLVWSPTYYYGLITTTIADTILATVLKGPTNVLVPLTSKHLLEKVVDYIKYNGSKKCSSKWANKKINLVSVEISEQAKSCATAKYLGMKNVSKLIERTYQ